MKKTLSIKTYLVVSYLVLVVLVTTGVLLVADLLLNRLKDHSKDIAE